MDGSDGRTDLRMSVPSDTGVFARSTAKPDGSMLLMGARAQHGPSLRCCRNPSARPATPLSRSLLVVIQC